MNFYGTVPEDLDKILQNFNHVKKWISLKTPLQTNALLISNQMWRMGNAGDDGAGAPDEMDNLRSSRGETVC